MIEEPVEDKEIISFNNDELIKVLENINYSLQTIANVLRNK